MNRNLLIAVTLVLLLGAAGSVTARPTSYAELLTLFSSPTKLDAEIPDSARGIIGTHQWLIIVQDGARVEYYWMTTQGGHVTATGRGRRTSPPVTAMAKTTRRTIDGILASPTPASALFSAIRQGAVQIQYSSAAAGWRLRAAVGAARLGLLGQAATVSTGKAAGAVCQHGGECQSGNCVGDGQGPPWTYRCSCDPFRYTTTGCAADASLVPRTKANGETCTHGGECQSGNCVGTGMGPPWAYACSCNAFVYRTSC